MKNAIYNKNHIEKHMNNLRRLKLRHLETFVEVARQSSISRAASVLHLSQPAVTRTIRELESIIGKPLVEKDGRGIRISHYGEIFLRHAGSSLAAARNGLNAVSALTMNDGPPVRIGALPTVSATIVPAAVAKYLDAGMRSRLLIVTGENRVLLNQLRNGELDLVMGRLPAPESMQGLIFEPLYKEEVVFAVRAGHPLTGQSQMSIAALNDYPVLVPSQASIIRPFVDRLFIEQGITEPRHIVETVSDSFGRAFLHGRNAIWIISRGVVAAELASGEFDILPIDTSSTLGSVGLNIRADGDLSSAAEFLADLLRAEAGAASQ
tara:strand:- start:2141 stop:3106 length:966 start_codon:yes stop_codon:yes gene_type:complete